MPRKPLYNEWQCDRLVARQQSIYALPASLAEYHAARGSLSSGPWNKCVPYAVTLMP